MTTLIDSLVISLGLDSSKFVSGQKDAEASMAKTKTAALKQGKELEESNKKFAESFNLVKRQAAEFFALIIGTASLKSFISDVTTASAALGRLSVNLGVAPQEMGAWGLAIERVGGQASEAASDFQELSTQLFDLQRNGKNIPVGLQKLAGISGDSIDYKHGIPEYLHSIGKAVEDFQRLGGSRSDAFNFLKQSGIGPGMAQLLLDNGSAIDKVVGSLKGLAPTDAQISNFTALQTSLVAMQQSLTAIGREIVSNFAPAIKAAADAVAKFAADNKVAFEGSLSNFVATSVKEWDALANAIDRVRSALQPVRDMFKELSGSSTGKAIGGVMNAPLLPGLGGDGPSLWERFKNFAMPGAHAGDFGVGFGQGSHPHPVAGLAVQGQQVSKGNPLPVTIVTGADTGGGGFWSWLTGGSSGGSGGSGGGAGGGIIAGAAKGLANLLGGGGNKGIGGWWTPDRVQHAVDRLQKEAGLSEMGAAGLVARWSGVEAAGGPTAVNPSSGAAGINQAIGSRKPDGYASWSFDKQLDYIIGTDLPSEKRAYEQLKNSKTMGDAARGASMYERAEGYNAVTGVDNYTSSTPVGKVLGMLHGHPAFAQPHRPVSHTPLSTMSALHPVTTASTSNSMHIDQIHVNAPNATNAHGIADRISDALRQTAMTTTANFGQA